MSVQPKRKHKAVERSYAAPTWLLGDRCRAGFRTAVLLALSLAAPVGAEGAVDPLRQADERFRTAVAADDYADAALLYGEVLRRRGMLPEVSVRRGDALRKAGRPAEALATYLRAQRYAPRLPGLARSLERTRKELETTAPPRHWADRILVWRRWLGYGEQWRLAVALSACVFALAICRLARARWRRRLAWPLIATALLASLALLTAASSWWWDVRTAHGIVVAETAVRTGDADAYPSAPERPVGTEFRILSRRGDWLHADFGTGARGWLKQDAAETY